MGGPVVLRDVAMATNFGTQFYITGFVGHNFDCMIASDIHCLILYIGGGFSGSSYPNEDIAATDCLRGVAMATIFGFLYAR